MTARGGRSTSRSPLLVLAAAAGVALLTAGVYLLLQPPRLAVDDAGALPAAAVASAGAAAGTSAPLPPPSSAADPPPPSTSVPPPTSLHVPPQPPEALRVPAVKLAARVVPIGAERSGALQLPDDPHVVGWWAAGALPGSESGSVVLAGHVDSARLGAGVLEGVVELPLPADVAVVDTSGDTTTYRLVARRTFSKTALPSDLFRREGSPQLVIVTCGGPFDTSSRHYEDNVVLYGVPEG
ncbi:MAG: class F sortase [Actinomycetes bacterium]